MSSSEKIDRPFVSLSSDFGIQSEGVGIMKGMVLSFCPHANVIDLTHGIASFNVIDGARELETASYLPQGIHVCVVDPGVGSTRWPILIETARGDILIGPNNGVLIPAARKMGGVLSAVRIDARKYFSPEKSRTFAGRDIFSAAAGRLAAGVPMHELGTTVSKGDLAGAPFAEAELANGVITTMVIHANKFGSVILNIEEEWLDQQGFEEGAQFEFNRANGTTLRIPRARSFSYVGVGAPVLVPDDYGRVELAINHGSFAHEYGLNLGDSVRLIPRMGPS